MNDAKPSDDDRTTIGEVVVFWAWLSVVAVGLAVMIVIPLMGR